MQGAGMALEALKQPVINGYFIAGSLVGPGGAGLIKVTSATALAARPSFAGLLFHQTTLSTMPHDLDVSFLLFCVLTRLRLYQLHDCVFCLVS